ncbi:MAG: hypothetical protein OCD01_10290 [Fibrobacterales bacterium]
MIQLNTQANLKTLLFRNLMIVVLVVLSIPFGVSSFCLTPTSVVSNECEIIAADECCGSTQPEQIECEYCYTIQPSQVSEVYVPTSNNTSKSVVYTHVNRLYDLVRYIPPLNTHTYTSVELSQEALEQRILATVFVI